MAAAVCSAMVLSSFRSGGGIGCSCFDIGQGNQTDRSLTGAQRCANQRVQGAFGAAGRGDQRRSRSQSPQCRVLKNGRGELRIGRERARLRRRTYRQSGPKLRRACERTICLLHHQNAAMRGGDEALRLRQRGMLRPPMRFSSAASCSESCSIR